MREKFCYKTYPPFLTLSPSCNFFLPPVIKNKCSKLPSKRNSCKAQFTLIPSGPINAEFQFIVQKYFQIGINMNLRN